MEILNLSFKHLDKIVFGIFLKLFENRMIIVFSGGSSIVFRRALIQLRFMVSML